MAFMFEKAIAFESNVESWDTSKGGDMRGMFEGATEFNSDLPWDTSRVTSTYGMFFRATAFDGSLHWDTSQVTNMAYMFQGATSFQDSRGGLSSWNITKVSDTNQMFA